MKSSMQKLNIIVVINHLFKGLCFILFKLFYNLTARHGSCLLLIYFYFQTDDDVVTSKTFSFLFLFLI